MEYGRARPVNPADLVNGAELKEVGLRAVDAKNPAAGSMFETEDASQGVSFGAVRPWLGALVCCFPSTLNFTTFVCYLLLVACCCTLSSTVCYVCVWRVLFLYHRKRRPKCLN